MTISAGLVLLTATKRGAMLGKVCICKEKKKEQEDEQVYTRFLTT